MVLYKKLLKKETVTFKKLNLSKKIQEKIIKIEKLSFKGKKLENNEINRYRCKCH